MEIKVVTFEQADVLRKLYAQIDAIRPKIEEALRTNGKPLEGKLLAKLRAAHDEESEIIRKIKAILG